MREICASVSGAARLAAIPAGESPASTRSPVHAVVISSGSKGDRTAGSLEVKALWGRGDLVRSVAGGRANLAGRCGSESGSPEMRAPREADCGRIGSAELLRSRRRPCRHRSSGLAMIELPGVIESGMPRRNGQRKPGTTRGSPRRSRTAKALRISCDAVKSRCARGWGGWGRLSDDGSRQHNSSKSEDPWGGGLPYLHGGARSHVSPDTVREY